MTTYAFRLFVSGMTPNSLRAIENIRAFCQQHLEGRYRLEIIDIYQQPQCAKEHQIVAVPTLVKQTPPPARRFIGDLSHTDRLLRGLGMPYLR
ncbi:KaiB 1 [Geomonas silvestris]|uniref:KaiB 1 n=2 Tax=Geomonas silvestris TaxID=2740184 RepID=A0A6V8MJ30_9BACT|nr:KaiB 1 [Geomonas silvestris]